MLQKIENYLHACSRLEEGVAALSACQDGALARILRDGVIQRFEFTFELAWKSLKDYMVDQGSGVSELNFPKNVLRAAYAGELISDEDAWLHMLDARNITSHVYDEKTAEEIAGQICGEFLPPLKALSAFYQKNV